MKTILITIMVVVLATTAWADDEKPGPSEVVVTNLTVVLPEAEDARPQFLWDQFANKPEETRFEVYSTQDWERNYRRFAATLVSKAKCATCRFWDGERTIDFVAYKPRYIKAIAGPAKCLVQNGRIARHTDRCPKFIRWEKLP